MGLSSWSSRFVVALFFATGLMGCSASSQWMHANPPPATLGASADRAAIVVMRPSGFGSAVRFTLMDAQGKFLGQPLPESYYIITVPPGQYTFVASAENADMVQATVVAGKTYHLLASVRMGVWSARVGLTAYTPHSEEWSKRDEWMRGSKYYVVDFAGGDRQLAQDPADVRQELAEAQQAWAEYDQAHRAERTLRPEDGI